MNFNLSSSNLLLVWNTYIDFEAFTRETGVDLDHFIEEWKEKVAKVQSAGCDYSELLLGLKLIEKVNLSNDSIVDVISKICSSNSDSESFLAQVVSNIKEKSDSYGLIEKQSLEKTHDITTSKNDQEICEELNKENNYVSYPIKFLDEEENDLSKPQIELHRDVDQNKVINSKKGARSDSGFLKCPICEKNFMLSKYLEKHIRTHDDEDSYDDYIDDPIKREVKNESNTEADAKNGHAKPSKSKGSKKKIIFKDPTEGRNPGAPKKKFPCDICGRAIARNNMSVHKKSHFSEVFKCTVCQKEFDKFWLMKKHMNIHKTTKDFMCSYCDNTYKRKDGLDKHISRKHKKGKSGVNGQSDGQNSWNASSELDTENDPTNEKLKKEIKSESSQESDSKTEGSMKNGTKEHTNGKSSTVPKRKFPCEICGRYIANNNMNVHIKAHFSEVFKCHICSREYKNLSLLEKHVETHSQGLKSFECSMCFKHFKNATHLKIHMETHRTTRDYICSVCGKNYKTKMTLNEHMNLHTKAKPLPCKFCDKVFFTHGSRKFHIRAHHTGEKPYKCDYCEKRFYISSRKVEHMRYHTGEKPFQCRVCGKYFRDITTRKRHIRNVHKEVKPTDVIV